MPAYIGRHRRSIGRSSARRRTTWVEKYISSATLTAGTNIAYDLLVGLEVAGTSKVGSTVGRTHFMIGVTGTDTDTAPGLLWGMIEWDQTAGASVPDPTVDFGAAWGMKRWLTPGVSPAAIGQPVNAPTSVTYGHEYDVKSRRRLPKVNDTWWLVLHNTGSQTLTYGFLVRTLVLLP